MSQVTWDLLEQRREFQLKLIAAADTSVQEVHRQEYRQIRMRIYRRTRRDRRVMEPSELRTPAI